VLGETFTITYRPASLVVVVWVVPVDGSAMLTVAPAIAAPCSSMTAPAMVALDVAWDQPYRAWNQEHAKREQALKNTCGNTNSVEHVSPKNLRRSSGSSQLGELMDVFERY
jgi:hypothetical protein